jgi:hypothetical protein
MLNFDCIDSYLAQAQADTNVCFASSMTTFAPFIKNYYNPGQVVALTIKNRIFYAKVKKSLGSGDLWVTPVIYANPQGLSATLANAQTVATSVTGGGSLQGKKWTSAFGDYSGVVDIGDKVIAASRDNVGAFFKNQTAEIDRLYEGFGDVMGNYFIGDAGHSVTPGTFTISTGVCTCLQPDDIIFVYVGSQLQASAGSGVTSSDTLLGAGSIGYVFAVNKNAGTFTVATSAANAAAATAGTPGSWTSTMYAFRLGDFGATAAAGFTRIVLGLGAWVPAADPTGGVTFENIDRTNIAVTELSGVRMTATEIGGLNNEARLKRLCARMAGRAAAPPPTDIFLHPEKWQDLADSLESRGNRPLGEKIAGFNFQKITIATAAGMVDVWADRFCTFNAAFAVNFDYIEAKSYTGFPGVINQDGTDLLRLNASNDYEYRLTCYPAFQVKAPGFQGRVAMA